MEEALESKLSAVAARLRTLLRHGAQTTVKSNLRAL
jgi:hypothetical protein